MAVAGLALKVSFSNTVISIETSGCSATWALAICFQMARWSSTVLMCHQTILVAPEPIVELLAMGTRTGVGASAAVGSTATVGASLWLAGGPTWPQAGKIGTTSLA
jgi:hypothetical protein